MLEGKTVGLIGAGVMAEVLALGLVRSKLVAARSFDRFALIESTHAGSVTPN